MEYSPMMIFMLLTLTPSDCADNNNSAPIEAQVKEIQRPSMVVHNQGYFTFNHGQPFLVEKDPLTGKLDFNIKTTPVRQSTLSDEDYYYDDDNNFPKEQIDRKDTESTLSQNGITNNDLKSQADLHKFLNLPIHYSTSGKYPLISSSYANTKVQGHGSSVYSNHKPYSTTTAQTTVSPSYYTLKSTKYSTTYPTTTTTTTTTRKPSSVAPKISATYTTTPKTVVNNNYDYEYVDYDYDKIEPEPLPKSTTTTKLTTTTTKLTTTTTTIKPTTAKTVTTSKKPIIELITAKPIEKLKTTEKQIISTTTTKATTMETTPKITLSPKPEISTSFTKPIISNEITKKPILPTKQVLPYGSRIQTEKPKKPYIETNQIINRENTNQESTYFTISTNGPQKFSTNLTRNTSLPITSSTTNQIIIKDNVYDLRPPSIQTNKHSSHYASTLSPFISRPFSVSPQNGAQFNLNDDKRVPFFPLGESGPIKPTQAQKYPTEITNPNVFLPPDYNREKIPEFYDSIAVGSSHTTQVSEKNPYNKPSVPHSSYINEFMNPKIPPNEQNNKKPVQQKYPTFDQNDHYQNNFNAPPNSKPFIPNHVNIESINYSQKQNPHFGNQYPPKISPEFNYPQQHNIPNKHQLSTSKQPPLQNQENSNQQFTKISNDQIGPSYSLQTSFSIGVPSYESEENQESSKLGQGVGQVIFPENEPSNPPITTMKPLHPSWNRQPPQQVPHQMPQIPPQYPPPHSSQTVAQYQGNSPQIPPHHILPQQHQHHYQQRPHKPIQHLPQTGYPRPPWENHIKPPHFYTTNNALQKKDIISPPVNPPKRLRPLPPQRHDLPNILPQFRPNAKVGHGEYHVHMAKPPEPFDTLQPPPLPRPQYLRLNSQEDIDIIENAESENIPVHSPLVHRRTGQPSGSSRLTPLQLPISNPPRRGILRSEYQEQVKEEPVFVVYPSNNGLINNPPSNDGVVVVGTRGSQNPVPPDNLDINDELDTFPLDDNHQFPMNSRDRVDTPILKTKSTAKPLIKNEFPYTIIKPTDIIEERISIGNEVTKDYKAFSPTMPTSTEEIKDHDEEINLIPYLQDYMPFATKKPLKPVEPPVWNLDEKSTLKPISVTLNTLLGTTPKLEEKNSIIERPLPFIQHHESNHPNKNEYTVSASLYNEKINGKPLINHKLPISGSPQPQDFQAPFHASLSEPDLGWSAVTYKTSTTEDTKTYEELTTKSNSDEQNKFDLQNFKPELIGGFKPIIPSSTDSN